MRGWARLGRRLVAAAVLAVAAASPAAAEWYDLEPEFCDIFAAGTNPATAADPVSRLQGGVRSFFSTEELKELRDEIPYVDQTARRADGGRGDQPVRLDDGRWGATTAAAMNLLCGTVPLAGVDAGEVAPRLALAGHYNDIAFAPDGAPADPGERWPNWRGIVGDPLFTDFLDADDPTRRERRRLRFAGTAPMVVALLDAYGGTGRETGGAACETLSAPGSLGEQQRGVLAALGFGARSAADREVDQLAAFCRAFPVRVLDPDETLESTLLAALEHFAFLQAEVPNAIEILASDAFATWVRDDTDAALTDERRRRLAGPAPAVLALLQAFVDTRPQAAAPAACAVADGWRYFELRPEDLDTLAQRNAQVAAVDALRGETFAGREALHAAAATALGAGMDGDDGGASGLDACSAALLDRAVDRLSGTAVYTLPPDAVAALRARLPAAAPELADVFQIEPGRDPRRMAERLQDRVLAGLAERRLAHAAELADTALQLAEPADQPARAGYDAAGDAGTAADGEDAAPNGANAADGEGAQAPEQAAQPAPADEDRVVLSAASRDILVAAGAPEGVLDELVGEPDVPAELRREVNARLLAAFDENDAAFAGSDYRAEIEAALQARVRVRADDGFIDGLLAQLPALQTVAAPTRTRVEGILDAAFPEASLFRAAASHPPAAPQDAVPADDMATLVDMARRTPDAPGQAFRDAVGGCGCRQELDAIVYGIYPFWMPAPAEPPPGSSRLDLARFSDVAFSGLRLAGGAHGLRIDSAAWDEPGVAAGFVTTARRHDVRADLAVDLVGWRRWGQDDLDAAVAAVLDAVNASRRDPFVWRDLLSLRFFDRWLSHELDGVTLRFEGLAGVATSDDARAAAARVVEIVAAVRNAPVDDTTSLGASLDVNLAFTLPGQDLAATERRRLVTAFVAALQDVLAVGPRVRGVAPKAERQGPLVLVFLDRPTTTTKKLLHGAIQDAFTGLDRRSVLRQTVAVVAAGAHAGIGAEQPTEIDDDDAFRQFENDLVYFEDNFAGAGFWPVPLADQPQQAGVVTALDRVLVTTDIDDLLASWAAGMPVICDVVCPNRVLFRALLLGLLAAFVAVAVLARLWCRFCTDIAERFFLGLILGTVLVVGGFIVSICDPWLRHFALELLGVVIILLVIRTATGRMARVVREDEP